MEEAIAEYTSYLRAERGLAAGTIEHETVLVRPFLAGRVREGGFKDLESLTAADVQAFVLDCARSASPARVQRTGTALRSLLRFLHLRGVTARPLAGAVPTAAGWKLSGLPRHLTQQEAARMVESCDLATVTGRRDRAVLLLLARMGLRPARPLGCGWTTSTGDRARSWCGARAAGTSGCPFRLTSAGHWRPTCVTAARSGAAAGKCSPGSVPRTGR